MSDTDTPTTPSAAPPKHRGGWPAGKPRKPQPTKPAREPRKWERFTRPSEEWSGEFATPGEDRFAMPHLREKYPTIAFQWVARSVLGNEDVCKHSISVMLRNHWEFVQVDDFPVEDVPEVSIGGMELMARPMAIHKKALAQEKRDAQDVLEGMRQKHLLDGIPNVSGGKHSSALRFNKHNRSLERLDIPGGERD